MPEIRNTQRIVFGNESLNRELANLSTVITNIDNRAEEISDREDEQAHAEAMLRLSAQLTAESTAQQQTWATLQKNIAENSVNKIRAEEMRVNLLKEKEELQMVGGIVLDLGGKLSTEYQTKALGGIFKDFNTSTDRAIKANDVTISQYQESLIEKYKMAQYLTDLGKAQSEILQARTMVGSQTKIGLEQAANYMTDIERASGDPNKFEQSDFNKRYADFNKALDADKSLTPNQRKVQQTAFYSSFLSTYKPGLEQNRSALDVAEKARHNTNLAVWQTTIADEDMVKPIEENLKKWYSENKETAKTFTAFGLRDVSGKNDFAKSVVEKVRQDIGNVSDVTSLMVAMGSNQRSQLLETPVGGGLKMGNVLFGGAYTNFSKWMYGEFAGPPKFIPYSQDYKGPVPTTYKPIDFFKKQGSGRTVQDIRSLVED